MIKSTVKRELFETNNYTPSPTYYNLKIIPGKAASFSKLEKKSENTKIYTEDFYDH